MGTKLLSLHLINTLFAESLIIVRLHYFFFIYRILMFYRAMMSAVSSQSIGTTNSVFIQVIK